MDVSSYVTYSRGLSLHAGGGQLDLHASCLSLCTLTDPAKPACTLPDRHTLTPSLCWDPPLPQTSALTSLGHPAGGRKPRHPSPTSSPTSACHARVEAESAEVRPAPSTAIVSPSSSTTLKSRSSLYFLLFTCRPERRFCVWDEKGSHGVDG